MSQETEIDDLDLDKLLDDEDFLEDFDLEEPVADSGLQAEEDMSSGAVVSSTVEAETSPADSATVEVAESSANLSLLGKILFPVLVCLAVLLLVLQIYAAWKIFFPKPHIISMTKKIAIAEVNTPDLAENDTKISEEETPQADIITFNFHYPLYSVAGLKIFGVDVQLTFPSENPSVLTAEQIEQLKKTMHDSLDKAVHGRMLEELGKYDDLFTDSLRRAVASTLKQWHLPPATIRFESLMVH